MNVRLLLTAILCGAAMIGTADENQPIVEELPPAEGSSPIGFGFLPVRNLEWPGPASDVDGFNFSLIAGHHREVSGLNLASFGCWTDGNLNGLALAGIGTWCNGASFGLHLTSVMNYAEGDLNGLQLALVNSAYAVHGFQIGAVNCVSDGGGLQLGVWNLAEHWGGIQVGLVNMAMSYDGIQIGLGNIIGESPLTACVLANAWF